MKFREVWFVLGLLVSTVLPGCGSGGATGPHTVRVSGTVSLEGKPLAGAEIRFVSDKFSGYGLTNSEGKYDLVQGAVPGKNKVFISKIEGGKNISEAIAGDMEQLRTAAESAKQEQARGGKVNLDDIPHETVPAQYSDPEKTKLTFTVPDGGATNADFRL